MRFSLFWKKTWCRGYGGGDGGAGYGNQNYTGEGGYGVAGGGYDDDNGEYGAGGYAGGAFGGVFGAAEEGGSPFAARGDPAFVDEMGARGSGTSPLSIGIVITVVCHVALACCCGLGFLYHQYPDFFKWKEAEDDNPKDKQAKIDPEKDKITPADQDIATANQDIATADQDIVTPKAAEEAEKKGLQDGIGAGTIEKPQNKLLEGPPATGKIRTQVLL